MKREKLTRNLIAGLPEGKPTRIADTLVRNLQLWVGETSRTFYLVIKHDGVQRNIKLCRYSDQSIDAVRDEARKKIAEVLNGECTESKRETHTLEEAVDMYIDMRKTESQKKTAQSLLERFAMFYRRKLQSITRDEIAGIHKDGADTPAAANRAVKYLSGAISLAISRFSLNMDNPAHGIELYKETPRDRFLDNSEAPRFIKAVESLTADARYSTQAYAILMLLYTGARKANVLSMRLEEIDSSNIWEIPRDKFKGGKHGVFLQLGNPEVEIVRKLCGNRKTGYVFERNGTCFKDIRKTMKKACEISGIEDIHIHDMRRTLATWMLSIGTPIAVVSKKLGHSSIKVTEQVYAHMLPDIAGKATEEAIKAMKNPK